MVVLGWRLTRLANKLHKNDLAAVGVHRKRSPNLERSMLLASLALARL